MFTFTYELRVRYGDTDQMGYVYYGNYAYYYEQARAEAIRSLGFSYKELEQSGIIMPVTRMTIKYLKPAYYDDLLRIETSIPHLPSRIIVFCHKIYNSDGTLLNEAETQLLFVEAATGKIKTAPEVLVTKLKPYFTA